MTWGVAPVHGDREVIVRRGCRLEIHNCEWRLCDWTIIACQIE